jgi:hypothetical protein
VELKQHARREGHAADEAKRLKDIALQRVAEKEAKQKRLEQQQASAREWGWALLLVLLLLLAIAAGVVFLREDQEL